MHLLGGHNYLPGCNKLEVRFEDEKGKLEVRALVNFCSIPQWLQASTPSTDFWYIVWIWFRPANAAGLEEGRVAWWGD